MPPTKLTYTQHLSDEVKCEIAEVFLRVIDGIARAKDPKVDITKRGAPRERKKRHARRKPVCHSLTGRPHCRFRILVLG